MLDVRSEADFNLFHLSEARRVDPDQVLAKVSELHLEPANTVIVLMSNDEVAATQAWKDLVAESVPNAYILEGGINNWLALFGAADSRFQPVSLGADDQLRYKFGAALGDQYPAATPDPEQFELEFTPKVQMQNKRGPSGGGCG
jgi:hypothetical protein